MVRGAGTHGQKTSIPSVTGNLLYYVDRPTDAECMAKAILELLQQKPKTEQLAYIARTFSTQYDYKKVAKEYYTLFKKVKDGQGR